VAFDSWPLAVPDSISDYEWERLAISFSASGVYGTPGDSSLFYADDTGRHIKVRAGKYGLIRGRVFYTGTTDTTLAIAANAGAARTDLGVVGLDRSSGWTVTPYVKTGPASLTLNTGTTGQYEIPGCTVAVPTGATSIAAGQVVATNWYLAPPSIVCTAATRPPGVAGLRIYQTDTKTWFTYDGSAWKPDLTDTPWTEFDPESGWRVGSLGCMVKARNGVATLNCEVTRVGNLAANADSVIATLGSAYRPSATVGIGIGLNAWINGQPGLGIVKPTGELILSNGPALVTGGLVVFQSASWPIG
jgi:hypothetical protein